MNRSTFQRTLRHEPAPPAESAPIGSRLVSLVKAGRFQDFGAEEMDRAFREMLNAGWTELFTEAVAQVRTALASTTASDRQWALASIWALANLDDLVLVPRETWPDLRSSAVEALLKEEDGTLRDDALEATALLLGLEAMEGDLVGVMEVLDGLEQEPASRSADFARRIKASRNFAMPALECFFREGSAVLDDKVLPFLHYLGATGAHTLTQLLDEEGNRTCRTRIMDLLKLLGPLSIPALKKGLVKGSWHLVRNALNLVADMKDPEAFEYVVTCLEHSDLRVLHAAVIALVKTGGPKAERYLLELLPGALPLRQIELLQGLGEIRAEGALPAILILAAGAPEPVRCAALETLGHIGHPGALPTLAAALERRGRIFKTAEPLPVRLAAIRAVTALGSPEGRALLERTLGKEPKGAARDALVRHLDGRG